MQRPLGAQISHMLKDRGVEVIFGIPGVHNQELYRGIEEAGITHVLARHEQGAGFMADGYARATGKPGVAYVITGPGLCNIMTPMGQAYSDSVPMLVISSCLDETAATRGQLHQMLDQRAAADTVCEWSEEARTAEAAYALIDRALIEMASGRPRPRHIQIPISVLETPAPPPGPRPVVASERSDDPMPAVIEAILGAKRPLFILGGGARGCGYQARDAVRALGAASFETYAGRGIVGAYALNYRSNMARPEAQGVLEQADVVVLVGSELSHSDLLRDDAGIRGRLIQVDIDPGAFLPDCEWPVLSRASDFFDVLLAALEGHEPATDWTPAEVKSAKARWRGQVDAETPHVLPVMDALRACLPDLTSIYSDMTQFAYVALECWPMERPGFWHHPSGFGTLGFSLPAAIGGAMARPGLPTLCIIGDYGIQYTIAELGTAVEQGLPLPILLWDNGKLGAIEDSMVAAQIAPNAVIQRNPDFLALARAYGAGAEEPDSLTALQEAVTEAFKADRPTLIRMTPGLA
ncbi:thiamine pyrophosphate-binding protein [Salibaculum griseiflavum]|uniref:Acetolactate synthase isozyme1 large subunit n=1 Tax=Salibaculum griseiflavum TaxID=1914409 RepID=A0A2V1P5X2_9RHOB|nr:thiamine pyrophosphate-binding protein [Salibaculum griseiflavum]PWG17198.1 acetolactate synthase isozyme1 large subunit [Salibaculum griseiflavum]